MEHQPLSLRHALPDGGHDLHMIDTTEAQDEQASDLDLICDDDDEDATSQNSSIGFDLDNETSNLPIAGETPFAKARPIFLLDKHRQQVVGLKDYQDNFKVYDVPVLDDSAHTGPRLRLLQIEPAQSGTPMYCKLITRPIFDAPSYIALSYSWGLEPALGEVYIGKAETPFRVSYHLLSALNRLRHETEVVTIWIDAICIDQQNLLDKSAQIQYMAQIFNEAAEVRVWIHELDDRQAQHMTDAELFTYLSDQPSPWWTRLWVLQECAYAKTCPTLMIGALVIPLNTFVERWTAVTLHKLDEGHQRALLRHLDYLKVVLNMWISQAEHNVQRRPLLERLRQAAGRRYTHPHDKFYAILSLVNEEEARQLPPDYSVPYIKIWTKAHELLVQSPDWVPERDMFLLGSDSGLTEGAVVMKEYLTHLELALDAGHFDTVDSIFNMLALERQSMVIGKNAERWRVIRKGGITYYEYPRAVQDCIRQALVRCAAAGQIDAVVLLLKHGASTKASGTWRTPLHAAAKAGHSDICRMLLQAGADVNEKMSGNDSAIRGALASGDSDTVRLILDAGADIEAIPLEDFDTLGRVAKVEPLGMLFSKGTRAFNKGALRTVFRQAARKGYVELLVQILTARPRDVPVSIALQDALDAGKVEAAIVLLEAGAKPGHYGMKTAAHQGFIEVVRMMIERGYELNYRGGLFGTALQDAVSQGHLEIARMLVIAGADVNVHESSRGCALELAAKTGRGDIMALLLDAGAGMTEEGNCFKEAMEAAESQGRTDLVELLQARQEDSWTVL